MSKNVIPLKPFKSFKSSLQHTQSTEHLDKIERPPIYCGVVQAQLTVSSCPLMKGSCMWKHRSHGGCMFTTDDLTPEEFALRVGLPALDRPIVNILHRILKQRITEELTN